ncbi:hypothetical protein [Burkholderia gladioli]|uniref:hypothetical protein n=1 Tax=Burkholderia gladioli TaxID=28095 RepID=UPI00163F84D1|nr:hypothetical protein [Burkholderia gladioli]
MKYVRVEQSGIEASPMTMADSAVRTGDRDCRTLHVVPRLFLPASALPFVKPDDVDLRVAASTGVEIMPDAGVVVRQPYPNMRYLVAGTIEMRHGWLVNIPESVDEFDIEFAWHLPRTSGWLFSSDTWECRHLIHVRLLPGVGRTYTMDVECWPDNAKPSSPRRAMALTGHEDDAELGAICPAVLREANLVRPCESGEREVVGHYIEEELDIPAIYYEQAWTLTSHEEPQIHEFPHATSFARQNEAHHQNACVEIPANVLVEAVRLARATPFEDGTPYAEFVSGIAGGFENHPANRFIAGWWDKNRPASRPFVAAFAQLWVRIKDDGMYCPGIPDLPALPVPDMITGVPSAARFGDIVLVHFFASWEHFRYENGGVGTMLVQGDVFATLTASREDILSGKHDDALYALRALAQFPSRFPAAWQALQEAAG